MGVCLCSWMALMIRQNCCPILVHLQTRLAPALVAVVTPMISCHCLRKTHQPTVMRCSWSLHLVETLHEVSRLQTCSGQAMKKESRPDGAVAFWSVLMDHWLSVLGPTAHLRCSYRISHRTVDRLLRRIPAEVTISCYDTWLYIKLVCGKSYSRLEGGCKWKLSRSVRNRFSPSIVCLC